MFKFKFLFVLFLILFVSFSGIPQEYTNNWHFGNYAGLNFSSGSPVALNNSAMIAWGGCASISDSSGNLICYTNGSTVYNKNNQVMQNGSNLMGDYTYGNYGPSVIIVPRPGTTTTYYIFSVNRNNTATGYPDALRYSTVVTTLNNGDGGVINRNSIVMQKTFDAKITAVKHANGVDYWVIVHESGTNKFYAFLVSNAGVNTTPVISQTGRLVTFPYTYYWWNGYLKASPDGKRIANSYNHYYSYTNDSANCEIFNFNNSTGVLSNPIELTISKYSYWYYWGANSIEFSPDGSKIYLADHSNYWPGSVFDLYQYDLNAGNQQDIQNSRTKIATVSGNWYWWYSGGMQLAKDGKIYVARYNSHYLGVINAPEQKGIGCCYQDSGVYLGMSNYTFNGLPQFVTSWFFKHPFTFKNVCHGEEAVFNITNTTCLDSVLWNFGDSSSGTNNYSTVWTGKHIFSKPGKYTVSLTTYRMGTENISKREIEVFPMPVKILYINDTFQCFNGNYFRFIDSTVITNDSITNRKWFIGNDLSFSGKITDTNHVFQVCDTHLVKIIYTTGHGCYDSVKRWVWVNQEPAAKFKINDSAQCFNENKFIFTNQSSVQYGTMSYLWNFGDTNSSAQKDPVHIYQKTDTFSISLIATTNAGCKDTANLTAMVFPSPLAYFSVNNPQQCLNGNKFIFKDSSSVQTGSLNYYWDFGDGSKFYSKDTSHIYQTDDTFTVRLVVITPLTCPDTMEKSLIVMPNPVSSFAVNDSTQCLFNNLFNFTNQTQIHTGTFTSKWFFGDNTSSSLNNPQHIYSHDSNFSVKLVTTSDLGCKDSIIHLMEVYPMPQATFSVNDSMQCYNEQNFQLTDQSSISKGTLTSLLWINKILSDTTTGSRIYQPSTLPAGICPVNLVVFSNYGCTDTASRNLTVFPSPQADFSISDSIQCFKWNTFKFNNLSKVSSGSPDYIWNFGDNTGSTAVSPAHVYSSSDTFTVRLITLTDKGCPDTIEKSVMVYPSPEISIGINDTNQCFSGNNFIFYNHTKIKWGSLSYRWFFGDGDSSSVTTPSHSYSYPDTFDLVLIAMANTGCSDTFQVNTIVKVQPMPDAMFTIDDSSQCVNTNLLKFNNLSTISAGNMTYRWEFGDGQSSLLSQPAHHYQQDDTFDVKLIAVSNWDCRDSFIRRAVIFPKPAGSFTVSPSGQCLSGNQFTFINTSQISSGSLNSYLWNGGDGNNSNTVNYIHSYSSADTFSVSLVAVSDQQCADTFSSKVIVFPMPVARFTVDTPYQCFSGNLFRFKDESNIQSGKISSWNWDMGDSVLYSSQNPGHSYATYRQYTVKLVVTSGEGCKDSAFRNVEVYPMPHTAFSINDTDQCSNRNLFSFTNQSVIPAGTLNYFWNIADSMSFSQKDVNINLKKEGLYPVRLKAVSDHGCSDSLTRIISVLPSPLVSISVNDTHQCLKGNQFIFSNQTSISSGNLSYLWDFGDNTNATAVAPSHQYLQDKSYRIWFKATSDLNCIDSTTFMVYVHPMPKADFGFSQPCLDKELYFKDLSSINSPDIISSWDWDFSDGSSNQRDPVFTFTTPGIKNIRLKVTSDYNCSHDTTRQLRIEEHVSAPYLKTVSVYDKDQIYMEWEKPASGIPLFYNIEKSINGGNFQHFAKVDASILSYYDLLTKTGENLYTYQVNAEDTCGYTGNFSNPGRNILLTVNDSATFPVITWTAYYDWPEGILEYILEIFDDNSGNFENLADFSLPTPFTDQQTEKDQEYYCYRITATHAVRPDVSSVSNIVCVPTTLYAFVPNAFTPNQDGINDTFVIKGKNIQEFNLKIFDKWGEEIFVTGDKNSGWDGKYNGHDCPPDVYFYILKVKGSKGQNKTVSGTLHLIR